MKIIYSAFVALFVALNCTPAQAQTNYTKKACAVEPIIKPEGIDCKGIWVLRVETRVPETGTVVSVPNPQCADQTAQDHATVARESKNAVIAALANDQDKLKRAAGNAEPALRRMAAGELKKHVRGDIGDLIQRGMNARTPFGNCGVLVGYLPSYAKVIGMRYMAHDQAAGLFNCGPDGQDCAQGFSRFKGRPTIEKEKTSPRTASTTFVNWSNNQYRMAIMLIYFRIPKGEPAPLSIL